MRKALITGGGGFIGLHLANHLLTHHYQIDLVDNFSRAVEDQDLQNLSKNPSVNVIKCDLTRSEAFNNLDSNYDYVYHLAAIIGVANVVDKPYSVLSDNVLMLLNMLPWLKLQKNLKRFIFASTSEVYAGTLKHFTMTIPTPEITPITVQDIALSRSTYMLSKIYGEALCNYSGLPFTIIRPHNFYGPRMGLSHVVPELLERVYGSETGGSFDVFSVNHKRTFCYIDDAVEMIRILSESENGKGETFNVGCQDPEITIGELANIITKIVEKELKIIPKPEAPGSPRRRCPDMSKTFDVTGYVPKTGLVDGIKNTYNWYKENVFSGKEVSAK